MLSKVADEQVFCAISDGGADSNNPMTIAIPAGTVCTGGSAGNACLLRVTNPPGFGSCFAIARRFSSFMWFGGCFAGFLIGE